MYIDYGRSSEELMHTDWYKIQPFINLLTIRQVSYYLPYYPRQIKKDIYGV